MIPQNTDVVAVEGCSQLFVLENSLIAELNEEDLTCNPIQVDQIAINKVGGLHISSTTYGLLHSQLWINSAFQIPLIAIQQYISNIEVKQIIDNSIKSRFWVLKSTHLVLIISTLF